MTRSLNLRAAIVSVAIFALFITAWHLATRGTGTIANMDPEYAKLMGATATHGKSAMPGPLEVGKALWGHLNQPFYDKGPNDKGVGIQLAQGSYHLRDGGVALDGHLADVEFDGGPAKGRVAQHVLLGIRIASGDQADPVGEQGQALLAGVGEQPFGGEGLSGTGPKAGGPHYLPRFATERTLTVNTAAVGGVTELFSK